MVHTNSVDATTGGGFVVGLADRSRRDGNAEVAGSLDIHGFLRLLRWRARLVAVVALGTVLLTAAVLTVLSPKYKATTVILVDPRQPRVTNSEAVLSGIGADAAAVESQVELIQSSALARKVIIKLGLAADPEFASASMLEGIKGGLLAAVGYQQADAADARLNRLIYKFQNGLAVHRRGLTYILEVSYFAREAEKAARISAAVAEAYLEDQRTAKGELTARASGWLGDRIEEMRERLRKSERAVADYKSANRIVDATQGNKLIARQLEDITQQLALARSRKAEAQGRLERAREASRQGGNPAALGEVLQSLVIGNLRVQYAEAARLEAEYKTLYGEKYPSLRTVRAQLADLRGQIDREIARVLDGVRNDFEVASSREAALEADFTKLKDQSETLGQADVALRELEREAQANRTLFEQFLGRAKETSEQQSLQIADARIVSPALTPIKPQRPAAILLLIMAAAGGIILGVGVVLMQEQLRRGFRTSSEIEQWLALPSLGILPQQTEPGQSSPGENRQASAVQSATARYALDNPLSDYAGSLWAVMTRLRRSAPPSAGEILVVASALPGEGKSTFACNLALASAASGTRTLLVDGDVYAAGASRMLGIQGPGLCEVLTGKAKFWSATVKDKKSGLHALGARDALLSASELQGIEGKAVSALLSEHRQKFDLIVIDSPAILPVDGGTFIECADRVVLMVEWERTERAAVLEALAMLGPYKQKLAGVVLNKASPQWYRVFDCGRFIRHYSPPPIKSTAATTRSAA
jgi:polysaccharide biosynthesis transport protein